MCRLALVSPMAIHKQGFHPTAILGAFGASIGISKILKNSDINKQLHPLEYW